MSCSLGSRIARGFEKLESRGIGAGVVGIVGIGASNMNESQGCETPASESTVQEQIGCDPSPSPRYRLCEELLVIHRFEMAGTALQRNVALRERARS
jgi:hypothetical protein